MSFTVLITAADGRVYRFGADEPDARWVPEAISFATAVPGGWKEGSFNLRRRADEDVPLRLLDEVQIIDEAGQSVYEGRIQQLPRQTGDDFVLGVQCLGWAAHLLDDPSRPFLLLDRDLGKWGSMSATYRRNALAATPPYSLFDSSVDTDPSQDDGGVRTGLTGPWVYRAQSAAMYDAGAARIGEIRFRWARGSSVLGTAGWSWVVTGADNDAFTVGVEQTANQASTVGANSGSIVFSTPKRYARVVLAMEAANLGNEGLDYPLWWTAIGVVGDHGIPIEVDPVTSQGGLFIDDMLGYVLSVAAPKLNFTLGDGGSIGRPPLVVLQAAYEPGSVENLVLDLNKYCLWDWLVYDNKTFFYRPTDPDRLTWEARLAEGVHLSLEGDDAEHVYNGAIVKYTTPDGLAKVAGPPGSGFDVEDVSLGDSSADSTVNQHGYPRKWIELDISFPILDLYAVTIGAAYLAQTAIPARSGSIELTGRVAHPTRGMRPVYEVRAGDWVRLSDHPADVPRRILTTSYDHDSGRNTVTVGNDVDKISALLEALGVTTSLKLGG